MRSGHVRLFQGDGTAAPTPTETPAEVTQTLFSWLPFHIPTWAADLLASIVVIALAYGVSRLLVRLLGRRVAQQFRRPSLTRTVLRGIRVAVYIFALLTIMGIYGLEISDIGLSVAVFSAVIGVVVAPIVGSFISGVFLLADQPYEIGDMIELADREQTGFVEDITLRHTKVFTLDNTFLVIPNGSMRDRDVVNYSAEDPRTRLALDVLVTYESDIPEARSLIERAARNVDNVIEGGPNIRVGAARYPAAPTAYINNFGDHGVLLTVRYWVTEPYKLLATRSKVQTNVWDALEDADVEIAYPHSHLYFDETSGEMQVSVENRDRLAGRPPADAARDPERDVPADAQSSEDRDDGGEYREG
ncbi:mechanosensitive ion channel family protein [Haloarcula nitratireducens]|uniref:Mechanosensitive ion channel family protein n=1 Tax=Haloarcula nitratireducens TaxID=2487749 RepID=A0AAW4P9R1_9EURY|nr:mechanosensitive ion channel family protein [Halomicroarcula nitratireducens]MBX0294400.1 mechanosensitive ion channel family protein [Halomicroarcula nitratireducens]